MFDIAIIGAGPAGATFARLAGEQYKILLIDKKTSPGIGEPQASKCCGGLLAPDAQKMLAKMGLGLPHHVLVGPQLFAVRTIDIPNRAERYYQRSYLNIDRGAFDQWLLTLVPSRTDIRSGCVFRSFERDCGRMLFPASLRRRRMWPSRSGSQRTKPFPTSPPYSTGTSPISIPGSSLKTTH